MFRGSADDRHPSAPDPGRSSLTETSMASASAPGADPLLVPEPVASEFLRGRLDGLGWENAEIASLGAIGVPIAVADGGTGAIPPAVARVNLGLASLDELAAAASLDGFVIALSLIAIVYIGFVALVQKDMKKLIAYSSVSHMGFVTLGIFIAFGIYRSTGSTQGAGLGMEGAMVQMISHGFISGALFLCVGVLYDRVHSREISAYGGVANTMPWFAFFSVLFFMANAGLPGTSGFVGEFMVILASFRANFWYAFCAGLTLILGAAYSLWLVKRVIFGDVGNSEVAALEDINRREAVVLGTLAVAVLFLGLWPAPLIELMDASVAQLLEHIVQTKLN